VSTARTAGQLFSTSTCTTSYLSDDQLDGAMATLGEIASRR